MMLRFQKFINVLKYLAILCCAFIGLFIGAYLLPSYDDIIYPFAPNLRLLWDFNSILLCLGFLSMAFALAGSWVYEKTMKFAGLASIIAIIVDYKFSLFTDLGFHYFHFSFVLVYVLGIYSCYWPVKKLVRYQNESG